MHRGGLRSRHQASVEAHALFSCIFVSFIILTMVKIAVCDSVAASAVGLRSVKIYLLFWQALMIVLLGTCAKVTYFDDGSDFNNRYQHFSGVEIMMFVGFGYLMTFLKRYGMGALGLTMLMVVLGLQWGIWIEVSVYFIAKPMRFIF